MAIIEFKCVSCEIDAKRFLDKYTFHQISFDFGSWTSSLGTLTWTKHASLEKSPGRWCHQTNRRTLVKKMSKEQLPDDSIYTSKTKTIKPTWSTFHGANFCIFVGAEQDQSRFRWLSWEWNFQRPFMEWWYCYSDWVLWCRPSSGASGSAVTAAHCKVDQLF